MQKKLSDLYLAHVSVLTLLKAPCENIDLTFDILCVNSKLKKSLKEFYETKNILGKGRTKELKALTLPKLERGEKDKKILEKYNKDIKEFSTKTIEIKEKFEEKFKTIGDKEVAFDISKKITRESIKKGIVGSHIPSSLQGLYDLGLIK